MPPDITAGLNTTVGPMPLVGTPPGVTAAGLPGTISPGLSTLFASLLAQSGQTDPKAAAPKASVPTGTAVLPVLQTLNALPTLTPAALPNAKQPVLKTTAGSLKTMDTLPELPAPPLEKAKAKAGELPLHKASVEDKASAGDKSSADAPSASSQTPLPSVVPISALPAFTPPVVFQSFALSAAAPTPIPSAKAALPIQAAAPSLREEIGTPLLNTAPAVGLPLPRTFALTASASVSQPDVQQVPQSVEAMPSAAILPSVAVALPLATGSASLGQPITSLGQPISRGKSSVLTAAKVSAASPAPAGLTSTVPDTGSEVQAAAQLPVSAVPLPTAAPGSAQSVPVTLAAGSSLVPPAMAGQNPAPPVSLTGKAAEKSTENALKSPAGNADNNTRTLPAATPITAVKAAPEKHGEAQADPVLLETGTLPGTQASVTVADTVPLESKPLSAADQAEIGRQAANGVGATALTAKPGAAQQMSLQLHPKDWGSLHVSVTVAPAAEAGSAKTVTAHIVAETPQVKAALESQTGALNQALRASGLHLEHLTVSVKTPDAKIAEVKPASQSASAGMSSGQGQPNTNGQPGANPGNSPAQAGQMSSFASFAGNSQNGRQGQPPPVFNAAAEPEPEEMLRAALPISRTWGRIDTRA